jgi:hypothetical protein
LTSLLMTKTAPAPPFWFWAWLCEEVPTRAATPRIKSNPISLRIADKSPCHICTRAEVRAFAGMSEIQESFKLKVK